MVDSPNDALQSHRSSARNSPRGGIGGPKSHENHENSEKLSPAKGKGYWGGRPLWDNSAYLTQTFTADSPSDNIQTHKVLGRNSPGDRVGGQKSLEIPEKVMKSCPSEAV